MQYQGARGVGKRHHCTCPHLGHQALNLTVAVHWYQRNVWWSSADFLHRTYRAHSHSVPLQSLDEVGWVAHPKGLFNAKNFPTTLFYMGQTVKRGRNDHLAVTNYLCLFHHYASYNNYINRGGRTHSLASSERSVLNTTGAKIHLLRVCGTHGKRHLKVWPCSALTKTRWMHGERKRF